jgi:hypothetical protein
MSAVWDVVPSSLLETDQPVDLPTVSITEDILMSAKFCVQRSHYISGQDFKELQGQDQFKLMTDDLKTS